jgi:hypothetical protein
MNSGFWLARNAVKCVKHEGKEEEGAMPFGQVAQRRVVPAFISGKKCCAQQTGVHGIIGSNCLITISLGVTSDLSTQCLPRQ